MKIDQAPQLETHPATVRLYQLKESRVALTMRLRELDIQAQNIARDRDVILAQLAPLEAALEGAAIATAAEAERPKTPEPPSK